MGNRRQRARGHWPVLHIEVRPKGFAALLYHNPAQIRGTVVGGGAYPTFAEALSEALIVARVLGAEVKISADAVAQFAEASPSLDESASQVTLIAGFET